MNIGERLRLERKRLGMTQAQIAKAGDVTVQSQRMYEACKRPPNAKYLNLLADMGVDVQYLITGHKSVNQKSIYREPTDALNEVLTLQEDFGTFDAEQIKTLLGFAWTYQVDRDGLAEFIKSAYKVTGTSVTDKKGEKNE